MPQVRRCSKMLGPWLACLACNVEDPGASLAITFSSISLKLYESYRLRLAYDTYSPIIVLQSVTIKANSYISYINTKGRGLQAVAIDEGSRNGRIKT